MFIDTNVLKIAEIAKAIADPKSRVTRGKLIGFLHNATSARFVSTKENPVPSPTDPVGTETMS